MHETPLTTEEIRVIELNAEYLGVTHSMLMQNAGRETARIVSNSEQLEGKHVVILCGLGGNGGDGMVAARFLQEEGANVDLYLLGTASVIANTDTLVNWRILQNLHGIAKSSLATESAVKRCKAIAEADILIDAMMGFGVKSKLREPILAAVKTFNKSTAKKYSIDVPTGIDSDTGVVHGDAVKADATIALHSIKPGHLIASEYVGTLHRVSIGIPVEASVICGTGDLSLFTKPRLHDSHKGDHGRVLVIGGSDVFSGAPALCAMAALRTGVDLVTILAPESVVSAIRSYSPNLMVRSLGTRVLMSESVDSILDIAKEYDVIALGPGLGLESETKKAIISLVGRLVLRNKRVVVDADGLKALASSGLSLDPLDTIVTPHWAELESMMDDNLGNPKDIKNRLDNAILAASTFNTVVLLKGSTDIVAHPDGRYKINRTGCPAMTVGGTGDVMTGIVSALLARDKDAFKVASASAFISGRVGEAVAQKLGEHIVATDCIEEIPNVMKLQL